MKSKPQAPSLPPALDRIRISIRPLLSFRPTRSLPPVNSMQPTMSSLKPASQRAPDADASAATPPLGRVGAALMRHRRHAALSALALSVAAGSLAAIRAHQGTAVTRGAATAVLKDVGNGHHVRWQQDAVDIVVDRTLSDLAGPRAVNDVVDAWRKSGAVLPSVSTTSGENRHVGYNPQGPNENVAVYASEGWAKANGALAVTVLTFDDATGRIIDADVLVNGGGRSFAVLDADTQGNGNAVAFESGAASASTQAAVKLGSTKSSRFDVQSVLTHEMGHFFGLGEDFDDTTTTMYAKTSPGETHKRVLTKSDSTVIAGLYAQSESTGAMEGATKAGCGGAHFARGHASVPTSTWVGWGVAVLGLGLFASSRRQRPEPRMIRVTEDVPLARRRSARRRAARCGGFIAVLGLAAAASPRELRAAPEPAQVEGDADVEVTSTAPRWVDGILETEVTLKLTACHVAACPEGEQRVVVAGGSLDHVTQVVGPYAAPVVGARATITLRDHSGLMKRLGPTYGTFK